jgi:hypothetical protein
MFNLDENKLRAAFVENEQGEDQASLGWVAPFDPISIDADELHRLLDDCLERGIIEKDDPQAGIAVYPLAISDPEPLLAVNPGDGPTLLGGEAIHNVSDDVAATPEDRSVIALRALVDDANALYEDSGVARSRSKDRGSGGAYPLEGEGRRR